MVVHFVSKESDFAQGRFMGPAALLRRLETLVPALPPHRFSVWEWRPWVDLMEGGGAVVPIARWRVPPKALRRLWAEHDERKPTPDESTAEVEQTLVALGRWYPALRSWGRAGLATQHEHPFDTPPQGGAACLESPSDHPWTPETYNPPLIRTLDNGVPFRDHDACIPLFRAWQALLLAELFIDEPRHFAGLRSQDLAETAAKGLPPLHWKAWSNVRGFTLHRPVLEALSWYATYTNHALMMAQAAPLGLGVFSKATAAPPAGGRLFEISGAAKSALLSAEAKVARDALVRNCLDHHAILRGATWLGEAGVRRRKSGHEAIAKAYAALLRQAVELLMKDGLELHDIKARLGEGEVYLNTLFPSWVEGRREFLRYQLETVITALAHWPDPDFLVFDGRLADEFVSWLEKNELLGAHMAFGALIDYGHRPDTDADVGSAFHVASLAVWVEHVCNNLLKNQINSQDTLEQKFPKCWSIHPHGQSFSNYWGNMTVPKNITDIKKEYYTSFH